MTVKTQNFIATIALTLGAVLPWPKRQKKTTKAIPAASKKFAFVKDPTGEAIFAEAGFKLITRLSEHTYVGILTGESLGEYVEVAAFSANGKEEFFFWIRKARIYLIEGEREAQKHLATIGKNKSTEDFNKIVKALN